MSASDISGITNELQVSHFGFSALSFSDRIYDIMVTSWLEVCEKEFDGPLKDLSVEERLKIKSYPFQSSELTSMFEKLKSYLVTKAFDIPSAVTLPESKLMHTALAEACADPRKGPKSLEKEFEEKCEKIRLLREKIAERKHDLEELENCSAALQSILEKQEEILEMRRKKCEMQKSPSKE